jgi:hypothetical protein
MPPEKDEHGIDGAEDHPEDDDYGEEDPGEDAGGDGGEPGGGPPEGPEEPAETEVHEVSAERPRRRRHGRRRHGRRRRPEDRPKPNMKLYAIVIGLVVIVPLVGAAWFFFGPAGSIRKIDLIARPYTDSETRVSGMALAAFIDAGKPSALSGTGDLKILRSGTNVYSGQVPVSDSRAMKNLPLNQFAVGNGDYRIEFSFQGAAMSTTFTISEIIEKVNLTSFCITTINNATLVQPGTARIGFTATFLNSADVTQLATDRDQFEVEVIRNGVSEKHTEPVGSRFQLNKNYPVAGNGNYTVKATFLNSKVKPGSQYSRIESVGNDSATGAQVTRIFIPPTAVAKSDKSSAPWKLSEGGATFKFDATGSITYEGATIINYTWDYGDGLGEYEAPKSTHTYTSPVPAGVNQLDYVVTLTIVDSNEQASSAQITVTVTKT